MTLANNTPYAALGFPTVAADGRDVVVAIVKATFARTDDGRAVRAAEQVPVRLGEVPHDPKQAGFVPNVPRVAGPDGLEDPNGPPIEVSLRYPSDASTNKPAVDVVAIGHAHAPEPVEHLDVALKVAAHTVTLRVHGERVFTRGATGLELGPPAKFTRRPLVYELAYGGTSSDFNVVERQNPVGRGVAARTADLVDRLAPCIEDPAHPYQAAKRATPAGFGAIPYAWQPRAGLMGTFDDGWYRDRMPLMPRDFDPRCLQVALPALQLAEPPAPGQPIAALGMLPGEVWRLPMPSVRVAMRAK